MKYLVVLFSVFLLVACEAENVEDLLIDSQDPGVITNPTDSTNNDTLTGGATVSFRTQIKPLIETKCATQGCHAAFGNSPTLETYAQINTAKTRVNARVSAGTMPQSGPLPQAEKDLIATWITEGAKNN